MALEAAPELLIGDLADQPRKRLLGKSSLDVEDVAELVQEESRGVVISGIAVLSLVVRGRIPSEEFVTQPKLASAGQLGGDDLDDEFVCIAFGLGELSEVECRLPGTNRRARPSGPRAPALARPVLERALALEYDGADIAAIELDGDVDALAEPVAQPEQAS